MPIAETVTIGIGGLILLFMALFVCTYGVIAPILAWRWGSPNPRHPKAPGEKSYYDDDKPLPSIRYEGATAIKMYTALLYTAAFLAALFGLAYVVGIVMKAFLL